MRILELQRMWENSRFDKWTLEGVQCGGNYEENVGQRSPRSP
uniref:Uncharacterized protein n=1 Tax=Parascaris equorum TaxID=6256 RepID=A0A914S317_PAREQ